MKAGWQVKKLGEVCSFENGDRGTNYPSRSARTSTGIPFINAGHLTEDGIDITCLDYIPRSRFDLLGSGKIRKGDILFCLRGSLGKYASVGDLYEGAIASSLVIIRPGNYIIEKFLLAYLASNLCSTQIEKCRNGAAQPNLSAGSLSQFLIPIPPLPEQQRIVAILDEAFDSIATAKASAEQNLKNAKELFDSYLQSVFTQRGEGWVEKRLGNLVDSISTGPFGTMLHKSDYVQEGIPLVNPMNIVNSQIVPSEKMMVSAETQKRLGAYVLKAGDVVIARRGELGRCALVTDSEEGWLCGTGSFFIRLNPQLIDGKLFVLLFGSPAHKKKLEDLSIGTTMSNLNHSILNNLVFCLPPLPVQQSIVARLDALSAETQSLEAIYKQKIAALDELKQSLLQKAFAGKL